MVASFVLHESHWQIINAKVASPVFCLLASLNGATICLEIPLKSPPGGGDLPLLTISLAPRHGRPLCATGGEGIVLPHQ